MPFVAKKVVVQTPTKLFLVLMREFEITQKEAQRMIDTKKVFQKGKLIKDKAAVVQGELEIIHFQPKPQGLKPIFEAKDFLLYDKPSGIMVHPRNRKSEYTLIDELKSAYGMGANIVHRIDKETSGLILAAKHKEAERELKRLFETKKIQKKYLALVSGELKEEILIDAPIAINRDFSKIKLKMRICPTGKPAQTIVQPLYHLGPYTLVEAIPLTGRQHQIRLHLFHIHHPIVGDPIYGRSSEDAIRYLDKKMDTKQRIQKTGAPRLMLHAYSLEFSYKTIRYQLLSHHDFLRECHQLIDKKYKANRR